MIVKVSAKPGNSDDLDRAIRSLREHYKRAIEQNERRPGFIRNPAAWALYKTWRMFDRR